MGHIRQAMAAVESLGAADWLTVITSYLGDSLRLLETDGQYPAHLCEAEGCDGRFPGLALLRMHEKSHRSDVYNERTNFPPMSSGMA